MSMELATLERTYHQISIPGNNRIADLNLGMGRLRSRDLGIGGIRSFCEGEWINRIQFIGEYSWVRLIEHNDPTGVDTGWPNMSSSDATCIMTVIDVHLHKF
jgi:hypothetical protein